MSAKRALSRLRAPDEAAAEDRAWAVVRGAYRAQPMPAPAQSRRRLALVLSLVTALAVGAAFSPAGAAVRTVLARAFAPAHEHVGVPHPARSLLALPASGRLLVSSRRGTWTVSAAGAVHRLGSWAQAVWSPHGLYVAVAGPGELAAVRPSGQVVWHLDRAGVSDPRWYPPNGWWLAYRAGADLRLVMGNGLDDHLLAASVQPIAPAWRPAHPYQLAYSPAPGHVTVLDAETRQVLWARGGLGAVRTLEWAADGSELLVVRTRLVQVYDPRGHLRASLSLPWGATALTAALSPDGRTVALVRTGPAGDLVLWRVGASPALRRIAGPLSPHRVLTARGLRQVVWSPDGRWLLTDWPAADQWVLVSVAGRPGLSAIARIAEQFAAGGLPRLEGWCCTGSAGVS